MSKANTYRSLERRTGLSFMGFYRAKRDGRLRSLSDEDVEVYLRERSDGTARGLAFEAALKALKGEAKPLKRTGRAKDALTVALMEISNIDPFSDQGRLAREILARERDIVL